MTKVGLGHGIPFNSFAVAEVAMAVPKNYIK